MTHVAETRFKKYACGSLGKEGCEANAVTPHGFIVSETVLQERYLAQ